MNDYVAGGWGATALILVLYCWRTWRRSRLLARGMANVDREKTWH